MDAAASELKAIAPDLLAAIDRAPLSLKHKGEQLKAAVQWLAYGADTLYVFFRREEIQTFTASWLVPQIKGYIQEVNGANVPALSVFAPGLAYLGGVGFDL